MTSASTAVGSANVVTGATVVLPGVSSVDELLSRGPDGTSVDPGVTLGKKGLRYKDRATALGLAAARLALADADLLDGETANDRTAAVVVSSNFGNVDTVCRVARTISDEGTRGVRPMDTANASSNVIASEIAIRFGLCGPNLMLCNGPTSGLDALRWADVLLRGGRAQRAVVLGVEPDNDVVRGLSRRGPSVDGGAAVVIETSDAARARGASARATLAGYVRGTNVDTCLRRLAARVEGSPGLCLVPQHGSSASYDELLPGVPHHDISARWGDASGALGVLQSVASVGWFRRGGPAPVYAVAGNDEDDATAGFVLAGIEENQ